MRTVIDNLRFDPEFASTMAAEFAADNRGHLETRLGRSVEPVDLYLAHFLGSAGAVDFLSARDADPAAAAAPLFPAAAAANRAIFFTPGGAARSLDDIRTNFAAKLEGVAPPGSLLTERVPLRDFRRVAEAMVELAPQNLPQAALVEAIRQRLGSLLVQSLVPLRMPLPIVTFDNSLEQLLVQAVRAGPEATWPFEPQLANRLLAALSATVQPFMAEARPFALVTAPVSRAAVSRLVRKKDSTISMLIATQVLLTTPRTAMQSSIAKYGTYISAMPS